MPEESRPTAEEIPGQKLPFPAGQSDMALAPDSDLSQYKPAGKLQGKVAIVTGADSGIGRAVSVAFAMEGADVAIAYLAEDDDAQETKRLVESHGKRCLPLRKDVRESAQCRAIVEETVAAYGKLDILVNNAAYQMAQARPEDITDEQFRRTMETNLFGYFFMVRESLPHLKKGSAIINSGSIVGQVGNEILIDYTVTKGGIHAMTKSLALSLAPRGIRVNAVLPGPVWTPAIPATMPEDQVKGFGHEVAMARPGQPEELAPAYVYLASEGDSSFVTGTLLNVTGGKLSSGD